MATAEGSFLSRWSKRKAQAQAEAPQAGVAAPEAAVAPAAAAGQALPEAALAGAPAAVAACPPAPTLQDVDRLTPGSDYARFVGRGVQPEVRNAALKKLFTDPQFNVMDGLDTYVGDYHTPDPLPAGMLRQMVQSQALGLFDDPPRPAQTPADAAPSVVATPPTLLPRTSEPAAHENADLQLQPDDGAGRPGVAPGVGADAGRER